MLPDRTVRSAPRRAPWLFPRLLDREDGAFKESSEPAHHGYGRPRRIDANPSLLLYVAWRRDIAGSTQREVAEALYGGPTAHIGSTEIKRVRDAERDGRALYRDRGTLPWAAYADGKPAVRWWTDPAFGEGVRLWQLQTVAEPSDEPQPDPAVAMREALDRTAGPLLTKTTETLQRLAASFSTETNIAFSIDREKLAQVTLRSHGIEPWECPGPGEPPDG